MGSLRRWLRKIERDSRETSGFAYIPQPDGTHVEVSGEEWIAAFSASTKRMCGEDVPEHPVSTVAANSPDPRWSRSLIAGTHTLDNGAERVGKPYEK